MTIEQQPFTRYNEEKKEDTFTCKLNADERKLLEECKEILEQEKDSTCLKQMAWFGAKVLREDKTRYLLETIFDNKRKNKRLGIVTYEA